MTIGPAPTIMMDFMSVLLGMAQSDALPFLFSIIATKRVKR